MTVKEFEEYSRNANNCIWKHMEAPVRTLKATYSSRGGVVVFFDGENKPIGCRYFGRVRTLIKDLKDLGIEFKAQRRLISGYAWWRFELRNAAISEWGYTVNSDSLQQKCDKENMEVSEKEV